MFFLTFMLYFSSR